MRAAGYIRVSTDEQAREGFSLEEQRRRIAERAEAEGWTLVEIYADEGWSGRRSDRPAYREMLDAAALGAFDALIVWRLDRLGRDTVERLTAEAALGRAGVRVVSLTEAEIDEADATAPLLRALRAGIAEMESRQIGIRVRSALEARARTGLPPTGRTPLGLRATGSGRELRWQVHEGEAELVKRIFAYYLSGKGVDAIVRELIGDGLRTRDGGRWSARVVARILDNPAYAGLVRFGEETLPGLHEAIIDPETFEAARVLRMARREESGGGGGRPTTGAHIFTNGLLRCGKCGSAMSPRRREKGEWYVCTGKVKRGDCDAPPVERRRVDESFLAHFEELVLDVEATVAAVEAELGREVRETLARAEAAEWEAAEAEAALGRIRADFKRGALAAEDWHEFRDELGEDRAAALAEAAQLRDHAGTLEAEAGELDARMEVARSLTTLREAVAGRIAGATEVEALRAAVTASFDRVDFHWYEDSPFLLPFVRESALLSTDPDADVRPRPIGLEIGLDKGETTPALGRSTAGMGMNQRRRRISSAATPSERGSLPVRARYAAGICRRRGTPSFCRSASEWAFAVLGEIPSRSATSSFEQPAAIRATTCR